MAGPNWKTDRTDGRPGAVKSRQSHVGIKTAEEGSIDTAGEWYKLVVTGDLSELTETYDLDRRRNLKGE